jgi:hypothetical protein
MPITSPDTPSLVRPEANEAIDALEAALVDIFPSIQCPLNHSFVKGMYIREVVMPAGCRVTSKIHKERHPYFVMKGKAKVWIDGKGWELIEAPFFGITEPGTRRVLHILETCHWVTIHHNPDDGEDLEVIEDRLIEHHDNPFLTPSIAKI